MSRTSLRALAALALIAFTAGCSGRHSPSGFRLPPGDADAGQKAFADLQCASCHTVPNADLPAPTASTPVALGGRVVLPPTDGDLTTDIVLPASHFASGYPASQVQEGSKSKMPDYTEKITIKQLADLVAFLQSKYTVGVAAK